MKKKLFLILLLLVFVQTFFYSTSFAAKKDDNGIKILCYHDVSYDKENIYTISPELLEQHIKHLLKQDYTFISPKEYVDINNGKLKPPKKPILLTFDDGYESFYTKVFPLLQKYKIPAMVSVIGSWMQGDKPTDVGTLVSWQQLKQMQDTNLVTVASHSYSLHKWIPINPYGDRNISTQSRLFSDGKYEDASSYQNRIKLDLELAQQQIQENLGKKTEFLVWPYGGYNSTTQQIALQTDFSSTFALDTAYNKIGLENATLAKRAIIMHSPDTNQLDQLLETKYDFKKPYRMAQVDIDALYDPTSEQITQNNIKSLISRLKQSGVNTVALQTFVDTTGSGNIEKVYFHSDVAPVKVDIFSHIATKFSQEGIQTYAWITTLANTWISNDPSDYVTASKQENLGWYKRLTPFDAKNRQKIAQMVADIAIYAPIAGILFQDDVYLNDFEDFSPAAKVAYREKFGKELTPSVRDNYPTMLQWSEWKTDSLIDFTNQITSEVKKHRPEIKVLRNIYPSIITKPHSEEWFAQNYEKFLQNYDFTVVMAYPYLEKEYDYPEKWLTELTNTALKKDPTANKIIIKIQTYDWSKNRWLTDKERFGHIAVMKNLNVKFFGYYPETLMPNEKWPK